MRIAYVAYWNAFRRDGVVKKIETQVGQWRRTGNEVRVFCLTPPGAPGEPPQLDAELFAFRSFRERLIETSRLARAVRRFAPDVVYLRYDLFLPTIRPVFRGRPVVVEFNEQPEEYALRAARANLYEPLNRRLILRGAKGFVCIAHELASSPFLASLKRPKVVIGNSLRLELQGSGVDTQDAQIVVNDESFWVYDPTANTVYRGTLPKSAMPTK